MNELAVLMPVYRDQAGLDLTLASLLADRGGPAFDIVIVDDGSEPGMTVDPALPVPVTLLRSSKNGGVAAALNRGVRHCLDTGYRYVARIDAGDRHIAGRFAKQVDILRRMPECGVIGGAAILVTPDGTEVGQLRPPTGSDEIAGYAFLNSPFVHPTVMIRADVFRQCGLYEEPLSGAEDYEFFRRVLGRHNGINLPEPVLFYEYSERSGSVRYRARQLRLRLQIQLRYATFHWLFVYGVVRTVALMAMPLGLVRWLKSTIRMTSQSGDPS